MTREEENRPPNEAQLRGFMTTADACCLMWHRVGGRMFIWQDVKDLLTSPSQLRGMVNRGYIADTGAILDTGNGNVAKVWQMTSQAGHLAEVREGIFR